MTLVEMLIALAVLAVLLGIAAPSFRTFLANTAVRSTAESLYQGFQLARAEAVRQNARVRLVVSNDTSWVVQTDTGVNIESKPAREGTGGFVTIAVTPTAAATITFNSFGRVTANADGSNSITQIDFSSANGTMTRRLVFGVTSGGLLCDPSITTAGDPRKCP
nr:GspH/FimT family pseudopilin [Oryzomicrobium sp.]